MARNKIARYLGRKRRTEAPDYHNQIAKFRQQISDADTRLAELNDARSTHVLGAANGDDEAKTALATVDDQIIMTRRERETLVAAIEQAEHLHAEHERQTAHAERQKREAVARKIATQIMHANRDADAAMCALRDALEKRAGLLRQLQHTGVINSTTIMKMLGNHGPTAAAHAAGLRSFMGLAYIAPSQSRSLTETSKSLNGVIAPSQQKTHEDHEHRVTAVGGT